MRIRLIVDGSRYFLSCDGKRAAITKKEAERMFADWKQSGRTIHRKYGLGGQVVWIWPD